MVYMENIHPEELGLNSKHHNMITFRSGLTAAFPIVIGYFPVAMAFGLLARNVHVSLFDSASFSLIVFAGASQFMALELIKAGVTAGNIILATFLLNLRHLLMSASLSVRLKEIRRGWLPVIAFGITDESFSVASLTEGKLSVPYMLALHFSPYLAWTGGTISGYLLGTLLPAAVQNSLGIGLYALFMALLVPEIKKSLSALFLGGMAGIFYLLIHYFKLLPTGWSLVVSMLAAAIAGVLFLKDEETKDKGGEEAE
jgi:4-azaleucine resistance transporter AzlC